MADTPKDKGLEEAFARMKETVAQEVEQHKGEELDLGDLEDASGGSTTGWKITYET